MLQSIEHGNVLELRMNRPPANALIPELVAALDAGLVDAVQAGAAGIVISGREGMFSGGLDVPVLIELERPEMLSFWESFFSLTQRIAGSPVPVAAALTGHSPAGGAVIAVHCDYRVVAEGDWKIGFNEVQVGLPVPSTIIATLASLVGPRVARRLVTGGILVGASEALALGFVDESAPVELVVSRAVQWCQQLATLPPIAMNRTRQLAKAELLAALANADDARVATDYWFSDETQAAMHALVDRLRDGRK